ncbi:MAG: helix-turn-helix transcriptional regulator [Candidatus Cloacimonetes bacterium]|jgi:AraC family transcriptional regulator|nr:helix-turn-helix transcriptional regulator [Candidatus Cloacimonadota bacterium]
MCYHATSRIPVSGHQDRDDGHLHTRRLHASELIRVSDTLCTAERNLAWGTTEVARATQVVLVRRGVFAYRTPRGASLADATSAMLLNAGEEYEVRHPLAGGDHCTAISFDEATVEDALRLDGVASGSGRSAGGRTRAAGPFTQPAAPVPVQAMVRHGALLRVLSARAAAPGVRSSHVSDVNATLGAASATGSGDAGDTLQADEVALALLGSIVRGGGPARGSVVARRARTERRWNEAVEGIRVYLAEDPSRNDSLPQLARLVHVSPYHLARVFRAQTGMSIHAYRTRLRIASALELLTARDDDLTKIGLALGFASHSHFTSRFSALTGMSPTAWRELRRLPVTGALVN